jgi:hypothetical protein
MVPVQVGDRLTRAALVPHGAGTRLALAALRGHAQFELDGVKSHARPGTVGDGLVADAAAHTNDHGKTALAGWLMMRNYKYEFVAFAITIDLDGL